MIPKGSPKVLPYFIEDEYWNSGKEGGKKSDSFMYLRHYSFSAGDGALENSFNHKTWFFYMSSDMFLPYLQTHFVIFSGRVVNVSSFVGVRTLNQCSSELQQRFRSEDITEDELVGLMQRFVDEAKRGEHKQGGWPETAYGVSKLGLTVKFYNIYIQNSVLAVEKTSSTIRTGTRLNCFAFTE